MHDILSQEEIDLLIQAATASKADEEDYLEEEGQDVLYDFSKPNKFSKEHIRGLQRIFEQFSRTYAGLMSAKLRNRLELKVHSIEQLTFGDFVRSLPNPSVLSVLSVEPLEGNVVVQLTPDIAFLLHDRLCGGNGELIERTRGLTDIEIAVLRRQVISVFCSLLRDAWQDVRDINFELEYIESNPQFLQVASDRDVIALVTLEFELNGLQDMVSICLPYRTLEPVMKDLTQARMFESLKRPDPARVEQLKKRVRSAVLPVEVELGQTTVSVQDLLELEVGDVIPLQKRRNETLDVKIGSLTKFKGTPGKLGSRLGVVITSICESQGVQNDE
ncbi:MAG: flagellar motor switch protein FliM [Firmicutes bacterium]|nr:flagellar motor switch protein FliM [Bacillota bacterium]